MILDLDAYARDESEVYEETEEDRAYAALDREAFEYTTAELDKYEDDDE